MSATRPQHERRFGVLLDKRLAEGVREILLCRPQLREVVEVRAAGLARLSRSARPDRAIPVRKIHDLAERGANGLTRVRATGREDGIAIAGARERSDVESEPS